MADTASSSSYCRICVNLSTCLTLLEIALTQGRPYQGQYHFWLGTFLQLSSRGAHGCESCISILLAGNPVALRTKHGSHYGISAHFIRAQPRLHFQYGNLPAEVHGSSNPPVDAQDNARALTRWENRKDLHRTWAFSTISTQRNEEKARVVDKTRLDFRLVKKWVRICDTKHHATCRPKYPIHLLGTATLTFIDVKDMCIVTPPRAVEYIALSYVWGLKPSLVALQSNIHNLRQPGAFLSPSYRLPQTVHDAATVTRELGKRYLWVDRVCITQDDPLLKGTQLEAMASVYANACLTIVAYCSEDATDGLFRVDPVHPRLPERPTTINLPTRKMVLGATAASIGLTPLSQSKWARRAWTLQEHVFSGRLLLMDKVVSWACHGAEWTEDMEFPDEIEDEKTYEIKRRSEHKQMKLRALTHPNLGQYGDLAMEYARRDMTTADDTENAFTGILTSMRTVFPGPMFFGVPEFCFDMGLLWRVRRGVTARCPNTGRGRQTRFPSWSWISWRGDIVAEWGLAEEYQASFDPMILTPKAQWWKQISETGAWVPVENGFYSARKAFVDNEGIYGPPPRGWTKHIGAEGERPEVYYIPDAFSHLSPPPKFRFPIPLPPQSSSLDSPSVFTAAATSYTPLIKFRGELAHVQLHLDRDARGRDYLASRMEKMEICATDIDILDLKGNWVGRAKINLLIGEKIPEGQVCEVIAIAQGAQPETKVSRYMWPEIYERREKELQSAWKTGCSEVVFVLWVGRVEGEVGMVHRKASGRIWKEYWDSLPKSTVDLTIC